MPLGISGFFWRDAIWGNFVFFLEKLDQNCIKKEMLAFSALEGSPAFFESLLSHSLEVIIGRIFSDINILSFG